MEAGTVIRATVDNEPFEIHVIAAIPGGLFPSYRCEIFSAGIGPVTVTVPVEQLDAAAQTGVWSLAA